MTIKYLKAGLSSKCCAPKKNMTTFSSKALLTSRSARKVPSGSDQSMIASPILSTALL